MAAAGQARAAETAPPAAAQAAEARGPAKVKVRLTHRPGEDTEVLEEELPYLRVQGLLTENKEG